MHDGKGSASATPQFLYAYARNTTQANRPLHDFATGQLTNAVAAYRATAIDFGGNIHGLTTGLDGSIVEHLLTQLGAVLETDAGVGTTGRAFEQAGSGHRLPWGGFVLPGASAFVQTTDGAVDAAPALAGAALAGHVRDSLAAEGNQALKDMDPFRALLESGDAQFAASFLRTLPRRDLQWILAAYGRTPQQPPWGPEHQNTVVQVLLQWYGNKNFDPALLRTVTAELFRTQSGVDGYTSNFYDEGSLAYVLVQALKSAPPETQARFAASLAGDPKTLRLFLRGVNDYGPDGPRAALASRKQFLAVLASAATALDPATAKSLSILVGKNLPKMNTTEFKAVLPELTAFYSATVAQTITPPPDGQDPDVWAAALGAQLANELVPFLSMLKAAAPDLSHNNELLKSTLQNFYLGVFLRRVPEPVSSLLEAWISQKKLDPLMALMNKLAPDAKGKHLQAEGVNAAFVKVGETHLVHLLLTHGRVYGPDGRTPLRLTGGTGDSRIINDIMRNPGTYHIDGSDRRFKSVANILDSFEKPDMAALAHLLDNTD